MTAKPATATHGLHLRPGSRYPPHPWTEDDGPAPSVFGGKEKGYWCEWTCTWSGSPYGLAEPNDLLPVDFISAKQARYELLDFLALAQHPAQLAEARRMLSIVESQDIGGPSVAVKNFLLTTTRPFFTGREYVDQRSLPERLMRNYMRPSWERP